MKGQMYETRWKMLILLKKGGSLSIDDLAKELKITTMAVRRHLSEMEKDGLVTSLLERRPVGRPRGVYTLTDLAEGMFPTAYPQMAVELLDNVKRLHGEGEIRRLFALRLEGLLERYNARMRGKSFAEKVKELAKLREEAGFLVDWEQHDDHLILKEYNCSVYEVAKKYPELCEYEIELYKKALDAEVVSPACIAHGHGVCRFLIKPRWTGNEDSGPSLLID